ncbi:hypothetical protein ACIGNX_14600 [Actinosynnema sp. NPDC053489]|uniref:hypothetical protein n=1 Tax=Actinosynnema sp. NPDC053489 TaxID=3363916 RepID=UPI0037C84B96
MAARVGWRAAAEEVARPFGARVHDGYDRLPADLVVGDMYRFRSQQRRAAALPASGVVMPLISPAHSARTARVGEALVRSAATGAEVGLRRRP